MSLQKELIDQLMKDYKKPEDLLGENGLFRQLKKALLERALNGELTHHLGYEKNEKTSKSDNARNGKTSKTILGKDGEVAIDVPRDRDGSFEPQIVKKHQRRFDGFDDAILSLYARGMTVREIQGHLQEIYGVEVSPDLISSVTDEVVKDVEAWQMRPLDSMYAIVYFDALILKIKDEGHVINKALYLAIGVKLNGHKEVLGMWIAGTEGAKFWLSVVTEIKNRGVQDILIACVDGLKGFPEAINAVFPAAQVQLCIVHMIRNSLRFVAWKDSKKVAADLRQIYTASTEIAARMELDIFRSKWDQKYPTIGEMWQRNWAGIIPFLSYTDDIRKVIYTTNAVESVNRSIRKVIKNRTIFPNDKAAFKLVYLALDKISTKWNMAMHNWRQALNQFVIIFGERVTKHLGN
jgi:putative transposase